MNLLPEFEQGFTAVMANKENIVKNINANMTFLPLCCSTGVLNSVSASLVDKYDKEAIDKPQKIKGVDKDAIKKAKYIHEIIKECRSSEYAIFFPIAVARWNAMSKILDKAVTGKDNGPNGGYNNYKAAQILMADRIVADKRDPKFKFNSYNIVFSVDHLMDWLEANRSNQPEDLSKGPSTAPERIGEVFVSTPKPGGHGARVRSCVFTPDHDVLTEYHNVRLKIVRDHVLARLAFRPKTKLKKAIDKVASSW